MGNKIKLDEKYSIVGNKNNWLLVFEEERVKQKLNSERKPTNEKENYIFVDKWYFNSIEKALNKYVNEVSKHCDNVNNLKSQLKECNETIKNLKNG